MAASENSAVASSATDFSSDSTLSDDWQELTKSDYAKVIFSDLLCNAASGTVECKFQITDNVHEDPSDYVGLYRIGYDDLSQCLVSKMLSQTKCEDDGKLQRCVFTSDELPCLDDGFYQFLYVTRDQEVCGASMPFLVKMLPAPPKEISEHSGSSSEDSDGGFILVGSDAQRTTEEKAPVQQSPLSEEKKEEIAAWVSLNPDYSSLVEQLQDHTYTVDALQQSKDLAMKEVAQLYEVLNAKNTELSQMKDMVAAYEEKDKMSQILQEEKNTELINMKKLLVGYKAQCLSMPKITQDSVISRFMFNDQLDKYQRQLKEKEEELSVVKNQYLLLEEKLKKSLDYQYEQEHQITILKREVEGTKKMLKEKETQQVAAGTGGHSLDNALKKAEDLLLVANDAIKILNFGNDDEVDKFFQLRIQLLIILDKMRRASDPTNVCGPNESVETEAVQTNAIPESSGRVSCPSSVESPCPPNSNETELVSGETSTALAESIPLYKSVEAVTLENQIIELPRLDVINEDIAKLLRAGECLEAEDITVTNRLTEKILNRGCNLFEAMELLDDCASDSGSDASDCSSSVKKDLLSVSRVLEALSSYLSNQTSLDHLIVVGIDEDRSLLHKNKWDVLLQKCSLRYQIELFLEHIEKQKEGIKKVSEKICDLLAQCMVLKDELRGSRSVCESLRSVVGQKDAQISSLKEELEFKNTLFSRLNTQKEDLEYRKTLAERTVEDFRARIEEASKIYKNQYAEIDRLTRKLEKYKSMKNKTKCPKESCSSESSTAASSFEVVKKDSAQNINDSDTGEHMFEKTAKEKDQALKSNSAAVSSVKRKKVPMFNLRLLHEPPQSRYKETMVQTDTNWSFPDPPPISWFTPSTHLDLTPPYEFYRGKYKEAMMQTDMPFSFLGTPPTSAFAQAKPEFTSVDLTKCEEPAVASDFASYEDFQAAIKRSFASIQKPEASSNPPECSILCFLCQKATYLCPEFLHVLMSHLESEHSTKTCPVCGQLFEDAVPPKYFHIHVEQHFKEQ